MQRSVYKAIQEVLRKPAGTYRLSKVLKSIHEEFSVGRISGDKSISFSRVELEKLRSLAEASCVADPLHNNVDLPRTKLAEVSRDEKLTGISVFGDLIQVAHATGAAIETELGEAIVPPYTLLSIPYNHLDLSKSDIVVVENGDVIRNWPKICLPPELNNAILLYRGHGESARHVRDLIASCSSDRVYAYYDFDPSGFSKATTLGFSKFIVPSNWNRVHLHPVFRFNKPDVFWNQQADLKFLLSHESDLLNEVGLYLKAHKLAITQEHLTAHQVDLTVIGD